MGEAAYRTHDTSELVDLNLLIAYVSLRNKRQGHPLGRRGWEATLERRRKGGNKIVIL